MTFLSWDLSELGAAALKSRRNSGVILDSSLSILVLAPTAGHLTLPPIKHPLNPSTSLHLHHQPRLLTLACPTVILSKLAFLPALLAAQLQPILCSEKRLQIWFCPVVIVCKGSHQPPFTPIHISMYSSHEEVGSISLPLESGPYGLLLPVECGKWWK